MSEVENGTATACNHNITWDCLPTSDFGGPKTKVWFCKSGLVNDTAMLMSNKSLIFFPLTQVLLTPMPKNVSQEMPMPEKYFPEKGL